MKLTMKGILRTLALGGIVAAAGAAAQAQVGFAVRVGPGAAYGYGHNYIPPCPGEGYIWTPAYYSGGGWVPGRWEFGNGYRVERRDVFYNHHRDYRFGPRRFEEQRDRGWDHGRR